MELQGSKTFENIKSAMTDEMQTSTKYKIYSTIAQQEGYQQISNTYEQMAINEQEHAQLFFHLLCNDATPSTLDNLKESQISEKKAWSDTYQNYANIAIQEGFEDIAKLFQKLSAVENHHEFLLLNLIKSIENQTIYSKSANTVWICMKCGCIWFDKDAPAKCPICGREKGYFRVEL